MDQFARLSVRELQSTFVSLPTPLRKIGGAEALPPEKSADLPHTVGKTVGLAHDGELVGGREPPTLRSLDELWVGRLRHRSSVGPGASFAYGSLSSGAAGTITSVTIPCKH